MSKAEQDTLTGDEEMAVLLPFFVAGTLSAEEHAQVARWIESSEDAKAHFEEAIAERAKVIKGNEVISPPSTSLSRLMESIESEPPQESRPQGRAMWKGLIEWLNSSPPALAWGATAAMLCVLVLGSATQVLSPSSEPTVVAGSNGSIQKGRLAIARFTPGARMKDIVAALNRADAMIVSGPKGAGVFEIRLSEKAEAGPVKERLVRLKQQGSLFEFIAEKSSGQ